MKKKITIPQFKDLFRSYKGGSFSQHVATFLFNDEEHPISKVCSYEIRNHIFDYIELTYEHTSGNNTEEI